MMSRPKMNISSDSSVGGGNTSQETEDEESSYEITPPTKNKVLSKQRQLIHRPTVDLYPVSDSPSFMELKPRNAWATGGDMSVDVSGDFEGSMEPSPQPHFRENREGDAWLAEDPAFIKSNGANKGFDRAKSSESVKKGVERDRDTNGSRTAGNSAEPSSEEDVDNSREQGGRSKWSDRFNRRLQMKNTRANSFKNVKSDGPAPKVIMYGQGTLDENESGVMMRAATPGDHLLGGRGRHGNKHFDDLSDQESPARGNAAENKGKVSKSLNGLPFLRDMFISQSNGSLTPRFPKSDSKKNIMNHEEHQRETDLVYDRPSTHGIIDDGSRPASQKTVSVPPFGVKGKASPRVGSFDAPGEGSTFSKPIAPEGKKPPGSFRNSPRIFALMHPPPKPDPFDPLLQNALQKALYASSKSLSPPQDVSSKSHTASPPSSPEDPVQQGLMVKLDKVKSVKKPKEKKVRSKPTSDEEAGQVDEEKWYAATRLQGYVRARKARRSYRKKHQKRQDKKLGSIGAAPLQAAVRRLLARAAYLRRVERRAARRANTAVVSLQAALRAKQSRVSYENTLVAQRVELAKWFSSAALLQSAARRVNARMKMAAARTVQSITKSVMQMRQSRRLYLRVKGELAARMLQAALRRSFQRRRYARDVQAEILRQQDEAARLAAEKEAQEAKLKQEREKEEARLAAEKEAEQRRELERQTSINRATELRRKLNAAALCVQSTYRCHLSRKKLSTLCTKDKDDRAAERLQAPIRRTIFRNIFIQFVSVASVIQAVARSIVVRVDFERVYCAIILQASIRRRKRSQEYKNWLEDIALKARLADIEARSQAGKDLAGWFKSLIVRRYHQNARAAVCVLQAHVRTVPARDRFIQERAAIRSVQAVVRRRTYRVGFVQYLAVQRVIAAMRTCVNRRFYLMEQEERWESSARIIQASLLRALARRKYEKQVKKLMKAKIVETVNTAAARLQAAVRCSNAQRSFQRKQSAGERLAAMIRRLRAQKMARSLHEAASIMQAHIRRRIPHFAVSRIQAAVRAKKLRVAFIKKVQRNRIRVVHSAAQRLQLAARVRRERDKFAGGLELYRVAARLQACVRRMQARNMGKSEQKSALQVQAMYRGHVGRMRGRAMLEGAERKDNAFTLQAVLRRLRARSRYITRIMVASLLQAAVRRGRRRAEHARDLALLDEAERHAAACRLQAYVRFRNHITRTMAASLLQAAVRRASRRAEYARELARLDQAERHEAACKLQTFVRLRNPRTSYCKWAQRRHALYEHTCRLRLQATALAYLSRCVYVKSVAGFRLSNYVRAMLARNLHVKEVAALKLQRAVRSSLQRKVHILSVAAQILQASVRMILAHKALIAIMETAIKTHAAVTLQAFVRMRPWRTAHSSAIENVDRIRAAMKLQECAHMMLARSKYIAAREAEARAQAARVLQAHVRAICSCNTLDAALKEEQRRKDATTLQAAVRRALARNAHAETVEHILRRQAATDLQVFLWAAQARRAYISTIEEILKNRAATKMQAAVRTALARMAYIVTIQNILNAKAATKLQAALRRALARNTFISAMEAVFRARAVTVLQASVRARLGLESHASAMNDVANNRAAERLQASARAALARRSHIAVVEEIQRNRAASGLQTRFRAAKYRRVYAQYIHDLQKKRAALELSVYFRRSLLRRAHIASVAAACVLQAFIERWLQLIVKRHEWEKCATIQRTYRCHLARQEARGLLYDLMRNEAASFLQGFIRQKLFLLNLLRSRKKKEHSAIRKLQAFARAKRIRTKYLTVLKHRDRKCAAVLQNKVRRQLIRADYVRKRMAAVVLQAAMRRLRRQGIYAEMLDEDEASRQNDAAWLIQSAWKGRTQMDPLTAACILQAATRRWEVRIVDVARKLGYKDPESLIKTETKETIIKRLTYDPGAISDDSNEDEDASRKKKEKQKKEKPPKPSVSPDPEDPVSIMFRYVKYGKYRDVEQVLGEGFSLETRYGSKQHTLLGVACMHGHLRVAKLLLRSGAKMNAVNIEGNTALHLSFAFKYRAIGEYLISKGADVRMRNVDGRACYDVEVESDRRS